MTKQSGKAAGPFVFFRTPLRSHDISRQIIRRVIKLGSRVDLHEGSPLNIFGDDFAEFALINLIN